jgi:hypothetical protein
VRCVVCCFPLRKVEFDTHGCKDWYLLCWTAKVKREKTVQEA